MRISARAQRIEPFYVMEMAKSAAAIAREAACSDRPMIYLNIGEPDFTAPPLVAEAAERAIRDGKTQYTQATGLPELRERISGWYRQRFGLDLPARRIVVTAGASGKKLDELYKHAWVRGLKTTYYLRTLSASSAEKSTGRGGELNAVPVAGGVAAPAQAAAPQEEALPATDAKFCSIDNPDCEACQ